MIQNDGTNWWYKNGHLHREGDKPAIVNVAANYRSWYKDGNFIKRA